MKQAPFAITLDPGTSLANQTGSWRTVTAGVRRPAAALQQRLPGRREHPELAVPRGGRRLRRRLAEADGGQSAARGHGPGLLPPLRRRLQPRRSSTTPWASTPSSASSATRRCKHGWVRVDASDSRQARAGRGRRPRGLSAAYHLRRMGHAVTIREAGPMAGGMMRFGIPKYRLPRDVLDGGDPAHPGAGRRAAARHQGRGHRGSVQRGGSTRCSSPSAPTLPSAHKHPGQRPRRCWTRSACCETWKRRGATAAGPARDRLRRRQHRHGRGPHRQAAGRDEAMIVYRRSARRCRPTTSKPPRREEEGVLIHWLRTIKQIDDTTFTVEKMRSTTKGRPQPTGEFETLEADTLILALGQDVDTRFWNGVRARYRQDGVVQVDADMMTGREASLPAATWCRPNAR